jgi:predicted nucleotidyltransferase
MTHQPNNIFAGTQVVSLVEVRGPSSSLVHPRGAVGVVIRTPAAEGEHFLVRFPDGFEKSLERSQIEVLKHFKDRLGNGEPVVEFDLESVIIYRCVVGSRAYGLDNDESDTDRRGIYLAPAELDWSLFGAPEQFEDNATQSCYWELQKFLTMALKANPNILECLYSPMVEKVTPLGAELVAARQGFLSQMIFQTFNGYALSQFKKIEQDIRSHGEVRWKHAMHLLRLLLTGAATLREARVPVRLESHRDRLLAVSRGELPWVEVDAWRKELHRDFERPWPKPNCQNAPTTKRQIASLSKPERKWQLSNSHEERCYLCMMRAGEIEANLVKLNEEFRLPYIADLVARKLSGPEKSKLEDADIVFHEAEYQRLRVELQTAHDASAMPELPNDETRAALNELLVRVRLKQLRNEAT